MLKQRWIEATSRERLLVTVMGVVVLGAVIFLVLVRPAWRIVQRAPEALNALDVTVLRMRAQAAELVVVPTAVPATGDAGAIQSVERELKTPGATVAVVRDGGGAAASVTTINLASVDGAKLAAWLAVPQVQQQLQGLTLTRDPVTGRVNGRVLLRLRP